MPRDFEYWKKQHGSEKDNAMGDTDNQKYLVKKYIKDNASYDYLISQMETGV